jgi:hypothetical protein
MQVRDLDEVIQHACPGGCCKFPFLKGEEFEAHEDEACPTCREKRFVRSNDRLVPVFPFIDFGVENIIRDRLFNNPEFCKLQGKGRDLEGDYYKSPAAEATHAAAEANISDLSTSCYELGIDWFEPYARGQHSIGLVCIRCGMHIPVCAAML